jgi:hypothetical protein
MMWTGWWRSWPPRVNEGLSLDENDLTGLFGNGVTCRALG